MSHRRTGRPAIEARLVRRAVLIVALQLVVNPVAPQQAGAPLRLRPYARVAVDAIHEMSGLVKSRRFADTYWTHNDSGDRARVFAIHEDGSAQLPGRLAGRVLAGAEAAPGALYRGVTIEHARNIDWEDIAIDGDTLYLADLGNNFNLRRDLGIYAVKEPDPAAGPAAADVAWIPVAYPDQHAFPPTDGLRFDCEALFAVRGTLFLITKHRTTPRQLGRDANLYRLDTRHSDRVNVLTKVDHHANLGGAVTAADVSPDGRTLAVLAVARTATIWLFDATAAGDRFFRSAARRLVVRDMKQAEAIVFRDNQTLIVGNEQRELYRIAVSQFGDVPR